MNYDYHKAVYDDVKQYIKDEVDLKDYETIEELAEKLNDDLWVNDSVTGNASGSYTFDTYKAEENLCHNLDLFKEACNEFDCNTNKLFEEGAEFADVTIRCYLLSPTISQIVEEIEPEFNKAHETEKQSEVKLSSKKNKGLSR